jgi:ClpP class serine protease
MNLGTVLALFLVLFLLMPVLSRGVLQRRRVHALEALEAVRGTRVIAMIHRQETVGFLGVPLFRYIDIEDSEAVLRAIRTTPDDRPIDILLHTPGGLVLASEQIAYALRSHPAKVTVLVPHYAMSGGTLVALAADEIVMDEAAVLGPVDPQLGDLPAAAIVRVATNKPLERLGPDKAETIAEELAGGHYTHDDPITVAEARAFGLPVSTGLPREAYDLMELYPQEGRRRPSVQFVPLPDPAADSQRRS